MQSTKFTCPVLWDDEVWCRMDKLLLPINDSSLPSQGSSSRMEICQCDLLERHWAFHFHRYWWFHLQRFNDCMWFYIPVYNGCSKAPKQESLSDFQMRINICRFLHVIPHEDVIFCRTLAKQQALLVALPQKNLDKSTWTLLNVLSSVFQVCKIPFKTIKRNDAIWIQQCYRSSYKSL